ncbi:PREDICTED: guanine nucleotide-binding protein subunit gamma 2-like isoform X2 [Lupinus angustifolius]|uniref:guanine nucleotide-binding protein subunit gamma 2-like isoform X2 n=1 Tax=Lupinus angustifolius TaxID=3871 RepID=UPI00092EC8D2|nr:PREDICTED: guanine nucleotide-binding protein subunit gamma 2-like isoform X2 [Lupinus angustifolius]
MASETSSSADEETTTIVVADKRGKHRILAELKRLHQDSTFLQEELEELKKTDNVSTISMDAGCYKVLKVGLIHYFHKFLDL